MIAIRNIFWLLALLVMGIAHAADTAEMKTKLEALMPSVKVDSIQAVGKTSMYEVVLKGGGIIYVTEDLSYGFEGNMINMETGKNITEAKRKSLRKKLLASLDESEMIIYSPKKTDYTLTVFTDIDCAYCRKLHSQMAEYNALGIRIRYMAFPRAGLDSESFDKAEDVWCADDRKKAMTDAKKGMIVDSKNCQSPVAAQYQLGGKLGVRGTPALFLESGESLPGYVPPKRLRQLLDDKAAKAKLAAKS